MDEIRPEVIVNAAVSACWIAHPLVAACWIPWTVLATPIFVVIDSLEHRISGRQCRLRWRTVEQIGEERPRVKGDDGHVCVLRL